MQGIALADDFGDTMLVKDFDGFYMPAFHFNDIEKVWRSIPSWSTRDDDVMLITYPKSGTHWLWEIISMILSGSEEYKTEKAFCMLEAITKEKYDDIASPRVLNSHMLPKHLPLDMFQRKNKIVLMLRNPKDVAVSYYNHQFNLEKLYEYHGEWKNYLSRFIQGKLDYGNCFDHSRAWKNFIEENPEYPIHIVYYEDLTENCLEEMKKMANFLQCSRDDAFLRLVEERCSFENMKQFKEVIKENEQFKAFWRSEKPCIYRKGKVGDWKNWFTVAQNEMFDDVIKKESIDGMFKFRYELK